MCARSEVCHLECVHIERYAFSLFLVFIIIIVSVCVRGMYVCGVCVSLYVRCKCLV